MPLLSQEMLAHLPFTVNRAVGGETGPCSDAVVWGRTVSKCKCVKKTQRGALGFSMQEGRMGGWQLVTRARPCRAGGLQCHRKQPRMCSSGPCAGETWHFFGNEFICKLFSLGIEKSLVSWTVEPQNSDLNPFNRRTVEMLLTSQPWNSRGERPSSCLGSCALASLPGGLGGAQ